MKKIIIIILVFSLTSFCKNDCVSQSEQSACEEHIPEAGKKCSFDEERDEEQCYEVLVDTNCNYESSSKVCSVTNDKINSYKCALSQDKTSCASQNVQCSDFEDDSTNCPLAVLESGNKKCSYDSNGVNGKKCFEVEIDSGCTYDSSEKICSFQEESNQFICQIVTSDDTMKCEKRNILCSDLDSDETKCINAVLQDASSECSYNGENSVGSKCYEVRTSAGCNYDNSQKKCTIITSLNDKVCDLEISQTPILCTQRNVQCIDFDEDETKCKAAVLQDASKKCNYKSDNAVGQKCYEEEIEAKCTFNEETGICTSTLPSKVKCEKNDNDNPTGCNMINVQCSDFNEDETSCEKAILSDKNKKCSYNSTNANKCYEESKECVDLFNEGDCNNYKHSNKLVKCLWEKQCKETRCETTDQKDCGKFKPTDGQYECVFDKTEGKCIETKKSGVNMLKASLYLSCLLLLLL